MRVARAVAAVSSSALLTGLVTGAAAAAPVGVQAVAHAAPAVLIQPDIVHLHGALQGPPSTAFCEKNFKIACYTARQIQRAFNLGPLYAHGTTGKGETIVIVDSYGSPTVAHDLAVFDKGSHLPAPPKLTIIQPAGKVARYKAERQPRGLGRRDRSGRRVRARHRSGREDPAGGDADLGERGQHGLPRDRQGREVRGQPSPRRRHQPELQRDRGELRQPGPAAATARRLHRCRAAGRERAGRIRGQRRGGRRVQRRDLFPAPGHVLAGQ